MNHSLQEELATVSKIRNRLALLPDDQFVHVFPKLGPKILARIDENTTLLVQNNSEVRSQIQSHLVGTLAHALERLRGLRIEAPALAQILPNLRTSVSKTLCLSLLRPILVNSAESTTRVAIPYLLETVDQLYAQAARETSPSIKLQLQLASWLLLDAISKEFGVIVKNDDDISIISWADLESKTVLCAKEARESHAKDGIGTFNIFLDIILFWPAKRMTGPDASLNTGVSIDGLSQIQAREATRYNELYLRQLKYIVVKFACESGLFTQQESTLLCIIASTGRSSMHARLAGSLLSTSLFGGNGGSFSLQTACCLLILAIGENRVRPILNVHNRSAELWEDILGPLNTASLCRSELPCIVTDHVVDQIQIYCQTHLDTLVSSSPETKLFIDLIAVLQDSSGSSRFWGIKLINTIYREVSVLTISDEWAKGFIDRCYYAGKAVLETYSDLSVEQEAHRLEDPLQLPLGVPMPTERRKDLNTLLLNHRAALKRRKMNAYEARSARTIAYELLTELAMSSRLSLSFLCNIMATTLKSGAVEDERMKEVVEASLETTIEALKNRLGVLTDEDLREVSVDSIFPSLIFAVCSDSKTIKKPIYLFLREVLSILDPQMTLAFALHLKTEEDPTFEGVATSILQLPSIVKAKQSKEKTLADLRQDSPKSVNLSTVEKILDDLLCTTSTDYGIDKAAAFALLSDVCFNTDRIDRSSSDLDTRLVQQMHDSNDQVCNVCMVCYDDVPITKTRQLGCGHLCCIRCLELHVHFTLQPPKQYKGMRCPDPSCGYVIRESELHGISSHLSESIRRSKIESFVNLSSSLRRCPGVDCSRLLQSSTSFRGTATCDTCDRRFCFRCTSDPHAPAKCTDFDAWRSIFGSSEFWVKRHSKPCPSCKSPIEKSNGCNHMMCAICGANFCWLCLSPLQLHLEPHTCNAFDPATWAETDEEQRALFYTERFQVHDDAEKYIESKLDEAMELDEDMNDAVSVKGISIVEACRKLSTARHFLKHSYIAGWSLRNFNHERESFEIQQGILETIVERLSHQLTLDPGKIYAEAGTYGLAQHFRTLEFVICCLDLLMERVQQSV